MCNELYGTHFEGRNRDMEVIRVGVEIFVYFSSLSHQIHQRVTCYLHTAGPYSIQKVSI